MHFFRFARDRTRLRALKRRFWKLAACEMITDLPGKSQIAARAISSERATILVTVGSSNLRRVQYEAHVSSGVHSMYSN
jgi:hypothetical protein